MLNCLVLTNVQHTLTFKKCTFCPHSVFMCIAWFLEQTAIISLFYCEEKLGRLSPRNEKVSIIRRQISSLCVCVRSCVCACVRVCVCVCVCVFVRPSISD